MRTIFALKEAQQHEAAIEFAESEMKNWEHSPDFFFALGDLLLDWANVKKGNAFEELLPMIEASWLKCLELGDQPALSGSVRGRGSHLAAHNLAVVYQIVGDTKQAEHYQKLAANR